MKSCFLLGDPHPLFLQAFVSTCFPTHEGEALALFKNGHPSARHSQVDYTKPDLEQFPQFAQANANEVILQPGDVLYLPTHWFHFIVSLELNFQCNARSGVGDEYSDVINACGF